MVTTSETQIQKFFGYRTVTAFRAAWKTLSDAERRAIEAGIEDGSLTY